MKNALKKRILSVLLAALLCVGLFAAAPEAKAAGVTFFAVDEKLLELGYGAIYYGGELYVSPGVFSNLDGVYTSYSSSLKMITMYNSTNSLVFDIGKGTAYTVGGSDHDVKAVISGGSPYVPLEFVCTYFGAAYSYLSTDIAPMIRLKTGKQVLKDSTYINAASALMQSKYNEYVSLHPELFVSPVTVCLLVTGSLDENTPALLESLESMGIAAAFFTDGGSIKSYPFVAADILARGHSLGALAETLEDAQAFNDALDGILMTRSRLVMGPDELSDSGYAVIKANVDGRGIGTDTNVSRVVSAVASHAGSYAFLRLDMNENTGTHVYQISNAININRTWVAVDETLAA